MALMAKSPYTTSHRDTVVLRPHLKFITKAVSEFYLNQSINLLVFFLKPYSAAGGKNL